MVKANDLINEQKKREDAKFATYNKIYSSIEKKIVLSSSSNFYYIWYEVPEVILGRPFYNLGECIQYLKDRLRNDGFKVEYYEPNVLLISWFPS